MCSGPRTTKSFCGTTILPSWNMSVVSSGTYSIVTCCISLRVPPCPFGADERTDMVTECDANCERSGRPWLSPWPPPAPPLGVGVER